MDSIATLLSKDLANAFAWMVGGITRFSAAMPVAPAELPPGFWSVIVPMLVSLVAMHRATQAPHHLRPALLAWLISLPVMYLASFWREIDGVLMLQILPVFSIVAFVMTFRRVPLSPQLAYALTFFSLLAIDVVCAVEYARSHDIALAGFIHGIGGAGLRDGLFLFPLLTAAVVAYGQWRQRGAAPGTAAVPMAAPVR